MLGNYQSIVSYLLLIMVKLHFRKRLLLDLMSVQKELKSITGMVYFLHFKGTSKADELYKVGKRTTDIMLEILNLSKTEIIPINTISNQEFTEDKYKCLRQSIKCGLISRLTVGDILDKAMGVQVARVNDEFSKSIHSFMLTLKLVTHGCEHDALSQLCIILPLSKNSNIFLRGIVYNHCRDRLIKDIR